MVAGTLRKFVDMISDMIFEIEHLFEALERKVIYIMDKTYWQKKP